MRDAVQPRFLLLATPRTGSTTVIRTLEQHPQIVGEREYLHAPNWRGANAVWLKVWRRWPELLIPLRAAMISRARRRPVYGLSVFPQHVRHIRRLTVRLQRAGWLILRLQRQSLFDQTLSYAVADRTKRWHRGREQVREALQLEVSPAQFTANARWLGHQRRLLDEATRDVPHEPLVYEIDLASRERERAMFLRLLQRLNLAPMEMESVFGKTWEQPYDQMIRNYAELQALPLEAPAASAGTTEKTR